MSNIPRIDDFAALVESGIGQPVSVFIKDDDPSMGPVLRPSHEMVDDAVNFVFQRLGIERDRDLESLCAAVARISVGRLVMSEGLSIEPGPLMRPYERIDVTFRDKDPVSRVADVVRS